MKTIISKSLVALAAVSALSTLALVSTDADARTYHGHGRARVGVYIGGPVIAPWRPYYYGYGYGYPYGYPYYSAPVVVQEQPVVYVEQQPDPAIAGQGAPTAPAPSSAPQAQQQQYWYYCQDSKTYYPHVQNCTSPWQRVIPHAPQ
jgi:hypothetical protein